MYMHAKNQMTTYTSNRHQPITVECNKPLLCCHTYNNASKRCGGCNTQAIPTCLLSWCMASAELAVGAGHRAGRAASLKQQVLNSVPLAVKKYKPHAAWV